MIHFGLHFRRYRPTLLWVGLVGLVGLGFLLCSVFGETLWSTGRMKTAELRAVSVTTPGFASAHTGSPARLTGTSAFPAKKSPNSENSLSSLSSEVLHLKRPKLKDLKKEGFSSRQTSKPHRLSSSSSGCKHVLMFVEEMSSRIILETNSKHGSVSQPACGLMCFNSY